MVNVLLVDDERDFADLLAQRLASRGIAARTAYDGSQAMEAVRENEPEVVVLDVNMPGMSGLETLESIKTARPHAEVVLLTADSTLSTAVSGMKLGAHDYLVKPADIEDLVAAIEAAGRRRGERLGSLRMAATARLAALGELAKGVAHEINNPLNIMLNDAGWIEDLLDEPEFLQSRHRPEMLGAVHSIQAQTERCKAITSKLLTLRGAADESLQTATLPELAATLLEERRERAKQLGITLKPDMALELSAVPVLRAEFEQLLGNLMDNALDAMEGKGGTLTVTAGRKGGFLEISVADTGIGMDASILPRIFEPFFSTKEVGKGTGLGLSICHGIAEALGGEIAVQSEPGRGSVFTVRVPETVRAQNGKNG